MALCKVVQWTLRIFAIAFCSAGFLLQEKAERTISDKLIEWWANLDDKGKIAASKTSLFIRGVSRLANEGFDLLLGERLFSGRSIGVSLGSSLCFTYASFFLFAVYPTLRGRTQGPHNLSIGRELWISATFVSFGLLPALLRKRSLLVIWGVGLLCISWPLLFIGYVLFRTGHNAMGRHYLVALIFFIAFSYLWDFLYILVTRWTLRRVFQKLRPLAAVILLIASNLALCFVLVFAPMLAGIKILKWSPSSHVGDFFIFEFPLNTIDVLASLLVFLLAAFVLIYRFVCWPLMLRPLYGIARLSILERRALFWTIGICLWNNGFVLKWFCRSG